MITRFLGVHMLSPSTMDFSKIDHVSKLPPTDSENPPAISPRRVSVALLDGISSCYKQQQATFSSCVQQALSSRETQNDSELPSGIYHDESVSDPPYFENSFVPLSVDFKPDAFAHENFFL